MNHRLTCDEVFDHLTRAPFPSGEATDRCVDEHLRVCHECRQMAEALRPATDLFQEVMSDDQRRRLPAYRGQLIATMTRGSNAATVESSTTEFTAWNPVAMGRASRHQQWYFLPALALALLLMAAILQGPGSFGNSSNSIPVAGATHEANQTMTCMMAGFALPTDCLPRSLVGPPHPTSDKPATQPAGAIQPMSACLNCHGIGPNGRSRYLLYQLPCRQRAPTFGR